MNSKEVALDKIKAHCRAFLTRFGTVLSVLTGLVLYTHVATFSQYGYSRNFTAHHSFLDYPNEISSNEAIELSRFIESLNAMWMKDLRIFYPFDKEMEQSSEYWAREIDVKDSHKQIQVIQAIAEDLGLPASKLPFHSHKANVTKGALPKPLAKIGIANPPDYLKIKKPPRAHVPQCDPSKLHYEKKKTLAFSHHQFKTTNIKIDGIFTDGGRIDVRTSTADEDLHNLEGKIKVDLTLRAQTEDTMTHISLTEVDDDEKAAKNIHINNHHTSAKKPCLVYHLDIIFPNKMNAYENLNLLVNHAARIEGDLKKIVFKDISVGLGRGAIHFKDLKGENIKIGTLNGIVLGNYLPIKTLGVASVTGATRVEISPQSKYVKSTIVSLNGPVKAIYSKDYGGLSKSSNFIAHCWMCEPSVISAKSPKNLHVTSSRRESIKVGYYKEICRAHVNVHSRTGESKLVYV
ncbi:hypothetical protein BD408DRAFT_422078 [Parasitella parasitica]|nr:hypothetical protein BD408DRAFT_422078 [Parasitella parasitica]